MISLHESRIETEVNSDLRPVFTSKIVGYTRRHLFQGVDEHKHSAIGKHLRDVHNQTRKKIYVINLPSRNAVESWIA